MPQQPMQQLPHSGQPHERQQIKSGQMSSRPSKRKEQALMANRSDIDRRLDNIEARLTWLDEHGTRGVDSLRAQVTNQLADLAEVNGRLDKIEGKIDSAARMRGQQYIGFAVALLPIYVLLFLTLYHVTPA